MSASGTRKKTTNTAASGVACSQAAVLLRIPGSGPDSGCDELVPLLHHVDVLVHDGVPAGDAAHALLVAAAVAHRAGLGQQVAVGALDVLRGGLAFHPVGPLVRVHL